MIQRDPHTSSIHVTFSELEVAMDPRRIAERAIERVVQILAERFITEKGQEILASLDPQAITNLTVAEAANAIAGNLMSHTKTMERMASRARWPF